MQDECLRACPIAGREAHEDENTTHERCQLQMTHTCKEIFGIYMCVSRDSDAKLSALPPLSRETGSLAKVTSPSATPDRITQ